MKLQSILQIILFFVGVVSESQIFNLTGQQLTVTYNNITGNYNSKNVTEFKEILLSAISGPGKLSLNDALHHNMEVCLGSGK